MDHRAVNVQASRPMQLDCLKQQVKEIAAIAATVPEEYRAKCFELLMTRLLGGPSGLALGVSGAISGAPSPLVGPVENTLQGDAEPLNALLIAFLKKNGLTSAQFRRVVLYNHAESIRFLREPECARTAQAQVQWALLLALKHAMVKGVFVVDPEEVRIVCQDKGVFDRRTFTANFRRCADYFRSAPETGGKPHPLSSKGIAVLGVLVKTLAEQP